MSDHKAPDSTTSNSTPNDPYADVGEGGCDCSCASCDIGRHCHNRGRGCKAT